jgi:DNA polymerase I-like protein with 3'-5' exonuclease and polymerase domains
MGGEKAALKFGIPVGEATDLVNAWRELYPEFGRAYKAFMGKSKEWRGPDGEPNGKYQYIRLENNRIKHFHEQTKRGDPENFKAWNFVVQGTGASVTEEAARRLAIYFDGQDWVLPILTVHDSLGWEVAEDFVDEFIPIMKSVMTDYPQYVVPLEIDVAVGYNWRDLEPYVR